MGMSVIRTILAGVILCCGVVGSAAAQYNRTPESKMDPEVFQIDEKEYLGAKVNGGYKLLNAEGREVLFKDYLGGQPLILVLSYYTCDGSCSLINTDLRNQLAKADGVEAGKDFRVLTLSFDEHDTLETTGAFRKHMELAGGLADHWDFATFKDPADINRLTESVGYKHFWSPRDRTFFHPGVFLFLSREGRLIRVLYAMNSEPKDVELAVMDAKQGQFRPSEIINFAVSLCYSYNYKEGRYTYNIPLFIAAGSLTIGVTALFAGAFVYRRRKSNEGVV